MLESLLIRFVLCPIAVFPGMRFVAEDVKNVTNARGSRIEEWDEPSQSFHNRSLY